MVEELTAYSVYLLTIRWTITAGWWKIAAKTANTLTCRLAIVVRSPSSTVFPAKFCDEKDSNIILKLLECNTMHIRSCAVYIPSMHT